MVKDTAVPDAWDDDWESLVDKVDDVGKTESQEEPAKTTKAERLAKHTETNKQIWETAEMPEPFHFLAARDTVPLKAEFKPALMVLSRKPASKSMSRQDPVTGMLHITPEDEDDESEEAQKNRPSPEELRVKAQREREEKQRKYEEVRARLFGTSDTGSGNSSPGNTTPQQIDNGRVIRAKGKGRGGFRQEGRRPDGQSGIRELYDPNHTPKLVSTAASKPGVKLLSSERSTPRAEEQIIRAPRGPDGSDTRGFIFANRGGKAD